MNTKHKRRRKPIRLKGYDYSQNGSYFITICTYRRELTLTEAKIRFVVRSAWNNLTLHYCNLVLDKFIIMPNHVHGIIIIDNDDMVVGAGLRPAPTRKSDLREVVRAFKSFSSRHVNQYLHSTGAPFWQRGYYEHIIRSEQELYALRSYIKYNPMKWQKDEYYISVKK